MIKKKQHQSRDDLAVQIQQQANELKTKNGQLRNGAEKQIGSEEVGFLQKPSNDQALIDLINLAF